MFGYQIIGVQNLVERMQICRRGKENIGISGSKSKLPDIEPYLRAYLCTFSFHEIAIYDVRQTIELIYKTTNRKAVYIGYSMGSTMGVVYSSLYPTEAENYLLGTYYYSTAVYWNHAKTYTYNVLRLIYPLLNV